MKISPDTGIFDLDGTLIGSEEVCFRILNEACKGHDLPIPSRKTVLEVVGRSIGSSGNLRILPAGIGIYRGNLIKQLMKQSGIVSGNV